MKFYDHEDYDDPVDDIDKEAGDAMTDEQIAAIEKRCNAATSGPWEYHDYLGADSMNMGIIRVAGDTKGFLGGVHGNDGEFLAHAREDIPAFLAEVKRLRAELQKTESLVTQYQDAYEPGMRRFRE